MVFLFPHSSHASEDPQLLDLEANLKGVLLKIGVSESLLGRSPCPPCDTASARSTDRHAFEVHMHTVQSAATELEATPHFQVSLHLCVQTLLPSCMHMSASCLLTYTDDLVGRAVVPKVPSWMYVYMCVYVVAFVLIVYANLKSGALVVYWRPRAEGISHTHAHTHM